jgi:Ca-activated chloride channel homolog
MRNRSLILRQAVLATVIAAAFTPAAAVVEMYPQNEATTFYQQGVTLVAAEKFEEAIKAFKEAIKLKPDYADAYLQLGESYREIGKSKEAVEAYKQCLKYQPDSARAYEDLGDAYSDYKKAVNAYNEAIRIEPKATRVHFKLGVEHMNHGNEQLAVAEYKVLQTSDPSLAQDLYNLIYEPAVPVISDGVVRLGITVLDSHGQPIRGLTSADFTVVEDGKPQTISLSATEQPPEFYGLAIDTSGSLRPIFNSVITTSRQIVEKLRADDQALVIRFISSDKIETVQDFTSSKRKLRDGIDTLYIEGGQSAVVDAVYLTAKRLASYKFPVRSVRRIMLLLSDGEDRASYYTMEQVLGLVRSMDIQVFAISLTNDDAGNLNKNLPPRSVDLLKKVTSETGGTVFFPKSTAELAASVNAVFDFVRNEYTVEYRPAASPEVNEYRSISVTVLPKSQPSPAMVIARTGYNLPPPVKK